jgi:hypothetical protein
MSDEGYRRRPVTMSLTELNALDDDGGESCLHPAIDFETDFEVCVSVMLTSRVF